VPTQRFGHPGRRRQLSGKSCQCHVHSREEADFAGMNEEWAKWFPRDPPARQGAKLPIRPQEMKVSIAVIAEA